jgi:hypothetical protein
MREKQRADNSVPFGKNRNPYFTTIPLLARRVLSRAKVKGPLLMNRSQLLSWLSSVFFGAERLLQAASTNRSVVQLPAVAAINRIVIPCWFGRLYLLQRHTALNHVLNALPKDGDHLLVHSQIGIGTKPPMARDYQGERFSQGTDLSELYSIRLKQDRVFRLYYSASSNVALEAPLTRF